MSRCCSRFAALCVLLAICLGLHQPTLARQSENEPGPNLKAQAPTPQKPHQKNVTEVDSEPTPEQQTREAISQLTAELSTLRAELQRLRNVTERNAATMELLLNEERLAKLEDKIQAAGDQKTELEARELEIQRRMRNIPFELISRGALRREEAEAAIKAELQRSLEDVRSQQAGIQQRISDLKAQAERLRARVETLRKAVEPPEQRNER